MPKEKVFVADLEDNRVVESVFLVASTSLRETRNGDAYLCVTLQDRTGTIEARAWDEAKALSTRFDREDFVAIRGRVSSFRDDLQITLSDVQRVDESSLQLSDFLPHSRWRAEVLWDTLQTLIDEEVESREIQRFLRALFDDQDFRTAYLRSPAAMQNHHAYIAGLIEHSLSMARLALSLGRHYRSYYAGLIDVDLVVAGCILHDMGKVEELTSARSFAYTTEGRLIGHITLGILRIDRIAVSMQPELSAEILLQLKHLVLSHHGKQEYGSPVTPQTPEAILLHHLDMVDSRMNMCWNASQTLTGDDREEAVWTEYHRPLRGSLFLGSTGESAAGKAESQPCDDTATSETETVDAGETLSLFGE
jgi:3'-5' exoribonuclease